MHSLRVVDQAGNHTDYETQFVPRIGERILVEYRSGGDPIRAYYFRVKDVMYRLDNPEHYQAAILVEEEIDPQSPWPGF